MNAIARLIHDVASDLSFMEWALVAVCLGIVLVLVWAQFAPDEFDMRHLVADPATGKIDRWAFIAFAGFGFFTWGFVKLLFDGKGDATLLAMYALIVLFPKVIEQVAGPVIRQRFGAAATPGNAAQQGATT